MPKRTRDHRETLIEDLRDDPEFAAQYVTAALEESTAVFLRALRDVAEAHRIAKVAEAAGLSRETLYRTLSAEGNPRFDSLTGILKATGLKITIQPVEAAPVLSQGGLAHTLANPSRQQEQGASLLGKIASAYSQYSQARQPSEIERFLAYANH
jgi:probable addiction module antidote protein